MEKEDLQERGEAVDDTDTVENIEIDIIHLLLVRLLLTMTRLVTEMVVHSYPENHQVIDVL